MHIDFFYIQVESQESPTLLKATYIIVGSLSYIYSMIISLTSHISIYRYTVSAICKYFSTTFNNN